MKRTTFVLMPLLAIVLLTGCAHRVGSNQPPSRWENVNVWNAQLALYNNAIAKSLIAAQQAGAIDVEYVARITEEQDKIARYDTELTNILALGEQAASGKSADLERLIRQINASARKLVDTGAAGVKNPTAAAQLLADIGSLSQAGTTLLTLLQQTGVVK